MDRDFIERRDFSAARRGYDPEEVDEHLRQVAEEVERLEGSQQRSAGLAGTTADRVRGIIDAAERSAAEIQEVAEEEAARVTSEAEAHAREVRERAESDAARVTGEAQTRAREVRERADADAAAHVDRIQQAAGHIMERVETAEGEVDRMVQAMSSEASGLLGALRGGAESLQRELDEIGERLPELREAGSGQSASAPTGAAAAAGASNGGAAAEVDVADETGDLPAEEVQDELASEEVQDQFASEEDTLTDAGVADQEAVSPDDSTEEELVDIEEEPEEPQEPEEAEDVASGDAGAMAGSEGARLIALNMALNGTPREETARYLEENFQLDDPDAVLDDVYSRVG